MRNCSRICWCSWGLIDAVSGYGDVVYSISNIDIWHPFNLWLIRQLKINFQDILLLISKNISDIGILCPFNLLQISQLKITVSEFEEPDHDDEPLGGAILVWSQAGIFFFFFLAVQDSSISDIVGLSGGLSEPTNNQSIRSIKEWS